MLFLSTDIPWGPLALGLALASAVGVANLILSWRPPHDNEIQDDGHW